MDFDHIFLNPLIEPYQLEFIFKLNKKFITRSIFKLDRSKFIVENYNEGFYHNQNNQAQI